MLIRSQDETIIVNIDNAFSIAIQDINGATTIYVGSQGACCIIAEYSTKSKAMKVLDMIQEAYGDSEYTKYVIPEVCRILSMKPKTEENKAHAGELGEMLKKGMTFQMPEDSEVVV
uniref:Uncharacterized protein n=1 Tax=Myoviridae sp. ctsQA11 TaxID=2825193 RepID=A0A8S5U7D3_9CAUD|nr:MAG TPA: hypothetical protein [Myoviridae sp. ctsQA11]